VTPAPSIWVETPFFKIEPGEDRDTNPRRYGRAFAHWLAQELAGRGEPFQQIVAEDWGWCVVITRRPFLLSIGCGNRDGRTDQWGAFVIAEPCALQVLLRTVDTRPAVSRLHSILEEVMHKVPQATRVWSEDPDRPDEPGPGSTLPAARK
jgi:hypothetical protein